jgi:hypothetical protein
MWMDNGDADLYCNIIELVRDIARAGDNPGIFHNMIPGGKVTVERALNDGYIVITKTKENANYYGLTILGLFLLWNQEKGELLRSRKVFDLTM